MEGERRVSIFSSGEGEYASHGTPQYALLAILKESTVHPRTSASALVLLNPRSQSF